MKGFVEPGSRWFVWEYERNASFDPGRVKHRHNPWYAPVKASAALRDFYAQQKADGTVDYDTYENILERLEKPADPVFAKIRRKSFLTQQDKIVLTYYIGLMHKRVPARQERLAARWAERLKRTDWNSVVRWAEQRGFTDVEAQVEQVRRQFERGMPTEIALKSMIEPYHHSLSELATMDWRFFVAPATTAFATSDNPVVFPDVLGIAHDAAVLIFPVSSLVALVASRRSARDLTYTIATKTRVEQINVQVLSNATKFGYFHAPNAHVQELLDRSAA